MRGMQLTKIVTNAKKMCLSLLIFFLSYHHVLQLVLADEITLMRHSNGDVFTIPGSCNETCIALSSNTANSFGSISSQFISNANHSCTCQCNFELPIFREDLRICVDNIQECNVVGFVSNSGLVEKVPYIYLPQYGQIIYPNANIQFEGESSPICVITGVQQLSKSGWLELRNLSDVEFPLSFYKDEQHIFLRWTGDMKLRATAEGKIVVVKLACRDSYPTTAYRGVFTPCVAFRVAGTPSRNSIKEVSFSTNLPNSQGLTSAEYTAIGVSSILLALIYVASISLYLHSRKNRQKAVEERQPEIGYLGCTSDIETSSIIKCNPLLSISRHFENDTNSPISEAENANKLLQSEDESEVEKITSAIIHPHEDSIESREQNCNAGTIIGERLPEEDVRIIETIENGNISDMTLFPGLQRRKLYFNPAYFERQLLLAPPPAAVDFLLKIREVISIAKHKMSAKRFIPTLHEIPEESSSERPSSKSLSCAGCPDCTHRYSASKLSTTRAISGESRVQAWLEDVRLLDTRWRSLEERRQQQRLRFTTLKDVKDVDTENAKLSNKSLPSIINNLSSNDLIHDCVNQILEIDRYEYETKRSTKSVTCEPGYFNCRIDEISEWNKQNNQEPEDNIINTNVREIIENAFQTQLTQLQNGQQNEKQIDNKNEITFKKRKNSEDLRKIKNDNINHNKTNSIRKTQVLLNIINDELTGRNSSKAKRIMDSVIQELIIAKEKEKVKEKETEREKEKDGITRISDYETDSLEKTKFSRSLSNSPVSINKFSLPLTTTLPLDEKLRMRNSIIDLQINEPIKNKTIIKNYNLPEVVPLRPENYALVSEVYVNDGYASPTDSDDDSGPEIQYESQNPGHLTIKVLDSPKNYIKQDESEYEPDTLDRKPMKLKINGDIAYDKNIVNEVYIDSLERSSQILLHSKRSFKGENVKDSLTKLPYEHNSLREIYEARMKFQQQQQPEQQKQQEMQIIQDNEAIRLNKRYKVYVCTSPLLPRQKRRQRKADNQPDVVPKPPPPPPPPLSLELKIVNQLAKNARGRSCSGAGDPTTCEDAPVAKETALIVGKPPVIAKKLNAATSSIERLNIRALTKINLTDNKCVDTKELNGSISSAYSGALNKSESLNMANDQRNERCQQYRRLPKWRSKSRPNETNSRSWSRCSRSVDKSRRISRSQQRGHCPCSDDRSKSNGANLEDSAYVSSPESNGSQCRFHSSANSSNYTESDESMNINGVNSESGAESVETDSVFFGNFRTHVKSQRIAKSVKNLKTQQRLVNYQLFRIKSEVY